MYSKFLLGLFFLCLIPTFQNQSFAQGFFKEAYILQGNDTIYGQIDWTDEKAMSLGIQFKQKDGTALQYFDNDNLTGYGFVQENIHYRSIPVSIRFNGAPVESQRFGKVWLRGTTELFKVALQVAEQEQNNTYYYVLKKGDNYFTLSKFKAEVNGTGYVQNRYQGMLKAIMQDCSAISANEIEKTAFHDEAILAIIKKYNACKNSQVATQELSNKSKAIVRHGIEGSFNRYYSPGDDNITNSQGYSLGFFWDIMEPDLSRRLSSIIGVNYMYMHYFNRDVNFKRFPFGSPERYAYNDRHYIRIPLLLQYNFNKSFEEKIMPFVNFGVTSILLPKFTYGAGLYVGNWKAYAQVENLGLSMDDYKIVSFAIGYKLPRKADN